MAIGSAIVMIVIGAILTFGIDVDQGGGLNIDTIGWILMVAGAVGAAIGVARIGTRSRRRTVETTEEVHRTADGGTVRHTGRRV